jgi:isopentenyl-diphosphate Delta-isomerase
MFNSSSSTSKDSGGILVPELVILVDQNDEFVGVEEKLKTHQLGLRHRAFSIFILNNHNELLLQRRAETKYHSRGLWSNTCCGHPRLGESVEAASHRRLQEEMGLVCEMHEVFAFSYRAELENSLIENEYDHVLIGKCDAQPRPNLKEVDDWKWMSLRTVHLHALTHPELYTPWFTIAVSMLSEIPTCHELDICLTNGLRMNPI